MFNRKPESDYTAYAHGDTARAGSPLTTASVLSPPIYAANAPDPSYSIINEWLVMRGDLESDADILVKGKIYGNVKCKMLIVDAGSLIEGGIEADDVIVRGAIKGVMNAKKVRLEKTADVDCEIHHQSFSAEEGAKIKGALRYTDDATRPPLRAIHGHDATH
jgi:cytoskeletal protein CcmA (bactofilin family)